MTVQNIENANARDFWVMVLIINEEQERLFVDSSHIDELDIEESVTIEDMHPPVEVNYKKLYIGLKIL